MSGNYNWRIKRKLIDKVIKALETRLRFSNIKRVKKYDKIKFYTLSSIISNHTFFMILAKASYSLTDSISKDYPNYFKWYWTKEIPRVFEGSGEVITCVINQKVTGVIFLKKDAQEKKICTLFVSEKYRRRHIGTKLLEMAFNYLDTTKPLITIPDYKVKMFGKIIKKYNWQLTQKMNKGYYNNTSCEYVYNGNLPD